MKFPEIYFTEGFNIKTYLKELQCMIIDEAVKQSEGNRAKAAKIIGFNRTSIVQNMKARGMIPDHPELKGKRKKRKKLKISDRMKMRREYSNE